MASKMVSDDSQYRLRTRIHTDGNALCKAGGGVVSDGRRESTART